MPWCPSTSFVLLWMSATGAWRKKKLRGGISKNYDPAMAIRWYGAAGIKPTTLMYSNGNLLRSAHDLEDAVKPVTHLLGRASDGSFRTACAKEYPSVLSQAFAGFCSDSIARHKHRFGSDEGEADRLMMEFIQHCSSLESGTMMPDYQPLRGFEGLSMPWHEKELICQKKQTIYIYTYMYTHIHRYRGASWHGHLCTFWLDWMRLLLSPYRARRILGGCRTGGVPPRSFGATRKASRLDDQPGGGMEHRNAPVVFDVKTWSIADFWNKMPRVERCSSPLCGCVTILGMWKIKFGATLVEFATWMVAKIDTNWWTSGLLDTRHV